MLGNDEVSRKNEHKHLGIILDDKLNFQSHIKEAIAKARRGIGIIKYLSRYVNREMLNQVYKLHVRPHLDYGDILYHKYDPEMRQVFTKKTRASAILCCVSGIRSMEGYKWAKDSSGTGLGNPLSKKMVSTAVSYFSLRGSMSPAYLFN